MVFSSVVFLFYFFPFFLFCYYFLPWKNGILLVASLIFYAWGEPSFVPLLVVCALLNYVIGYAINDSKKYGKLFLWMGIGANLAILIYYKYFNFVIEAIFSATGLHWNGQLPSIALPLGISFFTFQGISYIIDVYRGHVDAQKSFWNFAMYKAMFPQLIAGPIVRYHDVADQIVNRPIDNRRIWFGFKLFVFGLGQKVLVANSVALPVDHIFSLSSSQISMGQAWFGIACYTIQIYYDFCGYSNMAIGIGHMLGFKYPNNFNQPYSATSVTDFWRRWHMSLSSWFRDYLYIPLGGNRVRAWRTYVNLAIVFILCGLWHGAAWTFMIWGAWHGFILIMERTRFGLVINRLPKFAGQIYTLLAVMIGWVFFRAKDVPYALEFICAMLGANGFTPAVHSEPVGLDRIATAALVAGIFLATRNRTNNDNSFAGFALPAIIGSRSQLATIAELLLLGGIILLSTASLAAGTYNPFIYFRF